MAHDPRLMAQGSWPTGAGLVPGPGARLLDHKPSAFSRDIHNPSSNCQACIKHQSIELIGWLAIRLQSYQAMWLLIKKSRFQCFVMPDQKRSAWLFLIFWRLPIFPEPWNNYEQTNLFAWNKQICSPGTNKFDAVVWGLELVRFRIHEALWAASRVPMKHPRHS